LLEPFQMMKTIILHTLLSLISFTAYTQAENKTVVGVLPITGRGVKDNYLTEITRKVTESFIETHRFIVVDRTKMNVIEKERNLQKSESFIDGSVVEQGKSLGAEYLVTGNVDQYSNDGQVCKMKISLSILDVTTGQTTSTEVIDTKGGNRRKGLGKAGLLGGALAVGSRVPGVGLAAMAGAAALHGRDDNYADARKKVFEKSLNDIYPQIQDFVTVNFPATFTVVSVENTTKAGKAATLLIAGGKDMGIAAGQKMKLMKLQPLQVNGQQMVRRKQIGIATVKKVEDEHFCIAAVSDETEDIAAAIAAKEKIEAKTFYED